MNGMNYLFVVLAANINVYVISGSHPYDGRLLCSRCHQTTNTSDCFTYGFCRHGEECSTTEYQLSGQRYYFSGCMKTLDCDNIRNTGNTVHVSHIPHGSQVDSQTCCSSPGCNANHHHPNRPICMDCDSLVDPTSCEDAQVCDENEQCFFQSVLSPTQQWRHEFSCKDVYVCSQLHNQQTALSIKPHCCSGDFCNIEYALEYYNYTSANWNQGSSSTSAKTTAPIANTKPSTIPPRTTQRTTVSTTKRPTTTTVSTTSASKSTDNQGNWVIQRWDQVPWRIKQKMLTGYIRLESNQIQITYLRNQSSSQSPPTEIMTAECYTCTNCGTNQGQINVCSGSSPYCMTEMTNSASGYRQTQKRCASSNECDTLWLRDTQSSVLCSLFNENSRYYLQFNCSFCCIANRCNGRIVPPQETLYINHVI